MVAFDENFWGEKHNGFDVLQQNFKLGFSASKEFGEFLKERSSIEETYSKSLLKLANKCSVANNNIGTFEPCWKFLQSSTEKLANAHSQVIQNLSEVQKFLREYSDKQKETQKGLKDDFAAMSEMVLNLHNLSAGLVKAKEAYQQRASEVDKCRKEFTKLSEIKNAEAKFKKSCEEYKQVVEKRETARSSYQEKMHEMSRKLQTVEEDHLTQMLDILSKYGESIKVERFLLDQIIDEFGRNMLALTVENLLQQFLNLKQTGKILPVTIEFEEVVIESKPVDIDAVALQLKEEKKKRKLERKEKRKRENKPEKTDAEKAEKKEKKAKKKEKEKADREKATVNGTIDQGPTESENEVSVAVDSEGYIIRPLDTDSIHSGTHSKESYSSSDSESDSDDDEPRKIQIRIKPKEETDTPTTGNSTEDLRKLTKTLQLANPGAVAKKIAQKNEEKKFVGIFGSSQSLNKLSSKSRSNNDLLSIDNDGSKSPDTASLHSLPATSSFPDWNSSNSAGGSANFAEDFSNAFESISPAFSPSQVSPIGSPPETVISSTSGTVTSISPSDSFENSADFGTSSAFSADANELENAPPLPVKHRTASISASERELKKKSSTPAFPSTALSSDAIPKPTVKRRTSNPSSPEQTAKYFSNDLFVPASSSSSTLPANAFANFDAFKFDAFGSDTKTVESGTTVKSSSLAKDPPPARPALPPPASVTGKKQSSAASLPRPKPGGILPPPAVTNPRRSHSSIARPQPSQLAAPSTASASGVTQGSSGSATMPAGMSSLSDLLDINFSSSAPVLQPSNTGNELNDSVFQSNNAANSSSNTDLGLSLSPPAPPAHQTQAETTGTTDAVPDLPLRGNEEALAPPLLPPALPRRDSPKSLSPQSALGSNAAAGAERAIPIAVAFIEAVNAVFKGADPNGSVVKVTGDMTVSFPANIVSILSNQAQPPVLSFIVTGTSSLEQIYPNKALVECGGQLSGGEGMTFRFNMRALAAYLKKQSEQGANASYYNIDILKYQVRAKGISSAPIQFSAYWRCDDEQTDLKLEYKYNASSMSSAVSLNNVSVVVPVDGGVTIMQSKPTATWSSEHQRCMWKLTTVSNNSENQGANALRARFDISRGPTTPAPVAVQFTGEGSTISQLNFDLTSPAYKLSLVKKRFASGKYVVE